MPALVVELVVLTCSGRGCRRGPRGSAPARGDGDASGPAGCLTYPLYLVHEYWGWYFIHLLHPHLPAYPTLALAAALCLLAAWLVHRLVERPTSPLLKRLLDRAFDQVRTDDAAEAAATRAAAYGRQR